MIVLRGRVDTGHCSLCGTEGRVVVSYYGPRLCGQCCVDESARLDAEDAWPRTIDSWPLVPGLGVVAYLGGTLGTLTAPREGRRHEPWFLPAGRSWFKSDADEIWVHDSALEHLGWPPELDDSTAGELSPWRRVEGATIVVPRWEGHTFREVYRNGSPWWGLEPLELYHELCAFAGALGHRWIRSGAITSDMMLWHHWHGQIEPAQIPDVEIPDHDGGLASTRLELPDVRVIPKGLELRGEPQRWCYGFDLNANYLGAASNLALPTGEPAEMTFAGPVSGGRAAGTPIPPGYWRPGGGDTWVTTPALSPGPFQGWGYPEHHQYLQPWYKALRDARAALIPGAALDAVKATYRQGWGRLMSPNRAESDFSQRLYQPYWGQAVIANARERLRRRLARLPYPPAAVDTDGIFVISRREDSRVLALELGLEIGAGLGQWRIIGRCPGRAALRELAPVAHEPVDVQLSAIRALEALIAREAQ